MTPEPDPDPTPDPDPDPPTPSTVSFSVNLFNGLNNTYMVIIKTVDNDVATPITGGTAVINHKNELGTLTVPDSDTATVQFFVKAYNNQYTDWQDSYYSDAVSGASIPLSSVAGHILNATVQGYNNVVLQVI